MFWSGKRFKINSADLLIGIAASLVACQSNTPFKNSSSSGISSAESYSFLPGRWIDSAGDFFIADSGNNVVREVVAGTGNIKTIAGASQLTHVPLSNPLGVAVDSLGNLFIADSSNCVIREVSGETVKIVAGIQGSCGYSGDGGAATSAQISEAFRVAFDSSNNLYIADTSNYVVREVTATTGIITTVAGNNALRRRLLRRWRGRHGRSAQLHL